MAGVLADTFFVLGAVVLGASLPLIACRCIVKRWSRNMDVGDDTRYAQMLTTLSEASVRRNFDPYVDINWDTKEFAVTEDDPRWVLSASSTARAWKWKTSVSRSRSGCGGPPTSRRSRCT